MITAWLQPEDSKEVIYRKFHPRLVYDLSPSIHTYENAKVRIVTDGKDTIYSVSAERPILEPYCPCHEDICSCYNGDGDYGPA